MVRPILLVFCLMFSIAAEAQEELRQRLFELNQQIESAQADLQAVSEKLRALEREGKAVSAQISQLHEDLERTSGRIADAESEQGRLLAEIERSREETRKLEALSLKRVRALYYYEGRGGALGLLSVDSTNSFMRSAYYLGKVRAFDARLAKEIAEARAANEIRAEEVERLAAEQRSLRDTLLQQQSVLQTRNSERQRLKTELAREASRQEELLTAVRSQALRLETVLASLTNAGEAPPESITKKRRKYASKGFSSFGGGGLLPLKGKLRYPVAPARLFAENAGNAAPGNTSVPRKGIKFLTGGGVPVKTVASGKVIFVGRMPGLETVVIVDHGRRSYSLYGLLAEAEVRVGGEIDQHEVLGKTMEPIESQGNLYFEVRNGGIAVDPLPFFAK